MIPGLTRLRRLLLVLFLNALIVAEAVVLVIILKAHLARAVPFAEIHFVVVALLGYLKVMVLVKVFAAVGIDASYQHVVGVALRVVVLEEQLLLFEIEFDADGLSW